MHESSLFISNPRTSHASGEGRLRDACLIHNLCMLEYSHDWPVRLTVLSSLLASHEDDGVRKEKERLTAACGTRFLVQRLQGYWQMIRKDLTGRSSANQGRTLWLQRQCNNPVGRCNYRPIRCILSSNIRLMVPTWGSIIQDLTDNRL